MANRVYVYAFSNHRELVEKELSNKKALLKKRVNRSDNFVNLALLGAEKCLEELELDKETNLYMASNNGNMNACVKVLSAIFKEKKRPMPFNFLNAVNASILFFIAKSFGIEGKGIFSDLFETALPQAYVDVLKGKEVLLGVVNEAMADLVLHRKKFSCTEIEEHSCWLFLSASEKKGEAIASIEALTFDDAMHNEHATAELFAFLEEGEGRYHFRSRHLSFVVIKTKKS
jgi:hypothetical protein